jgi:hypothetical protein
MEMSLGPLGIIVAASFDVDVMSGQIGPPPKYRFEVAVIKPSDQNSSEVWLIPEAHGGFRAQNVTVWDLIKGACYIRDQQLTGGPAWIKTDRYDITAKPAETEPEPIGSEISPVRFTSYMARHRSVCRRCSVIGSALCWDLRRG